MAQRWIMHIDMDAFFASVEQMDDPSLRGKPVAVGGSHRGVVSAASYEARRFGVRSALPMSTALRLCPHLIVVPGRMRRYAEISHRIMDALREFSPLVEPASVDEAYLDATGLERLFGPVENMGMAVKARVLDVTGGLTCSVGAAPVKFLAKIASDVNKPNGLFILYPEDVAEFLRTLPVGRIPGVGKRSLDALEQLGVRFAGDVLRYSREFWERRFGKGGVHLHERASGVDPREVEPYSEPKSESAENTFSEDTADRAVLRRWLLAQAERVGASLRRQRLAGRTITLKVKYADFRSISRSHSLPEPTASTETIFDEACRLLDALTLADRVRLIGVGVSNFGPAHHGPRQLTLPLEIPGRGKGGKGVGRDGPGRGTAGGGGGRDAGARGADGARRVGASAEHDEQDGPDAPDGPDASGDHIAAAAIPAESIPPPDEKRRRKLDAALDALRDRHGREAVVRGRLFGFDSRKK
ncbi:DNA polymerase IV [Nitratidesulfovibrio sp. SRB-5]|uniref:DNA polymerase IV n=1 Tax=Nitratidesulfovibrio sp. SRB-5 TaxID=2872636 RepID=UPI001CBA608D|nr:DNA polymerase IV [Nitratidesulfovibrio sp. SRB-5]